VADGSIWIRREVLAVCNHIAKEIEENLVGISTGH